MDFNSSGLNAPIHIIRKRPFGYVVGTLKSKGNIPQTYIMNIPQKLDLTVSVDGVDENIPGVPSNIDAVEYGNSYYCLTQEAALQAVANHMQLSSARLAERPYDESVLSKGEEIKERLNPKYAEEKRQAKTIKNLQERQDSQDQKLDSILSILSRIESGGSKK